MCLKIFFFCIKFNIIGISVQSWVPISLANYNFFPTVLFFLHNHVIIYTSIFFSITFVGLYPNPQNLLRVVENSFPPFLAIMYPISYDPIKVPHDMSVYLRNVVAMPHFQEQIHLCRNFGPSSSSCL